MWCMISWRSWCGSSYCGRHCHSGAARRSKHDVAAVAAAAVAAAAAASPAATATTRAATATDTATDLGGLCLRLQRWLVSRRRRHHRCSNNCDPGSECVARKQQQQQQQRLLSFLLSYHTPTAHLPHPHRTPTAQLPHTYRTPTAPPQHPRRATTTITTTLTSASSLHGVSTGSPPHLSHSVIQRIILAQVERPTYPSHLPIQDALLAA